MDFSTNHDNKDNYSPYGFEIYEDLEDGAGVNTAQLAISLPNFIDSRTELAIEIRKAALEFMKRSVAQLEKELSGK